MSLIKLANDNKKKTEDEYNNKRTAIVGGATGALNAKRKSLGLAYLDALAPEEMAQVDGKTRRKLKAKSGVKGAILGSGVDHGLQRYKNRKNRKEKERFEQYMKNK